LEDILQACQVFEGHSRALLFNRDSFIGLENLPCNRKFLGDPEVPHAVHQMLRRSNVPVQNVTLMSKVARKGFVNCLPRIKAWVPSVNEGKETANLLEISGQGGGIGNCMSQHTLPEVVHIINCIIPSLGPALVVAHPRLARASQLIDVTRKPAGFSEPHCLRCGGEERPPKEPTHGDGAVSAVALTRSPPGSGSVALERPAPDSSF